MKAVEFFYENAGYSYKPPQTPEQGRRQCAKPLSRAERWLAEQNGHTVEWEEDDCPDRSGIEHGGPLWRCCVTVPGIGRESLCGIDLGEAGPPDPYQRVVVAEIACELMP